MLAKVSKYIDGIDTKICKKDEDLTFSTKSRISIENFILQFSNFLKIIP